MSAGPAPTVRSGTSRAAVHRTGALHTGTHRTGTHRTGLVRGGAGGTASARAVPQRAVGHRTAPSRSVPVRPDLRLVSTAGPARARRTRARSSRIPFVLLILALLIGTTLSLLVLNTAIAVDSLKATALRQENNRRTEEVQRLEQQVVNGSTPEKLAGEAAAAGLVPAGTAGYLVVEPDGTSSFRGTPTPAAAAPPAPSGPPAGQPASGQNPAGQAPHDTTGGN
jgi:hypothetical protein